MTDRVMDAPAAAAMPPRSSIARRTLRATYVIWYRDLLRYSRDWARVITSLAQPLLFLIIFGTGLGSALSGRFGSSGLGIDYQQYIFPGIIGMAVLFTAIFGAMSIVWDREFGFLKEILVAPIDRSSVAVGKSLGGATQAMIQGMIMLILAPFIGVHLTLLGVVALIPLVFLLAFSISAFGVVIASRMKTMQGFQVVMNFLMMPLFFLSGALFPLNNLPGWMTVLTRLDPVSYGIDAIRRVVFAGAGVPKAALDAMGMTLFGKTVPIMGEVAILVAVGALFLALAVRGFRARD